MREWQVTQRAMRHKVACAGGKVTKGCYYFVCVCVCVAKVQKGSYGTTTLICYLCCCYMCRCCLLLLLLCVQPCHWVRITFLINNKRKWKHSLVTTTIIAITTTAITITNVKQSRKCNKSNGKPKCLYAYALVIALRPLFLINNYKS